MLVILNVTKFCKYGTIPHEARRLFLASSLWKDFEVIETEAV